MSTAAQKRYYEKNAKLVCERSRAWQAANPEKVRAAKLRRKFGIALEEYDRMVVEQKGLCAICEQPCPTGRLLAVDHCHKTGRVRGLLCSKCNTGIGQFGDDIQMLERAIDYLKERA